MRYPRILFFLSLCCLLILQAAQAAFGQQGFNVRNTHHSLTSILSSVHELKGSYYTIGLTWDSSHVVPDTDLAYNVQGVLFTKYDQQGNILLDTFYDEPYPGLNYYPWNFGNESNMVGDTAFVIISQAYDTADMVHIAILTFDTLGHNTRRLILPNPSISLFDTTFWNAVDLQPTMDGTGNWLLLSTAYFYHVSGGSSQADVILTKLDSDFHVIWHRRFGHPLWTDVASKLLIEPDGYTMASGLENDNITNTNQVYQVQLRKTDTAGNELWHWISVDSNYTTTIRDVKRTSDGGYIYCGGGGRLPHTCKCFNRYSI